MKGINVTYETLAVDLIHEVGPGGHFLDKKHTLNHYEEKHLIPMLFSRETREKWKEDGSKDIWQKAREEAMKIPKEHEPEPLDKDIRKRLTEIVKKAETKSLGK